MSPTRLISVQLMVSAIASVRLCASSKGISVQGLNAVALCKIALLRITTRDVKQNLRNVHVTTVGRITKALFRVLDTRFRILP